MGGDLSNKRILNVSQAARYLGYSRGWIEHWIREGFLPYESPPSQGKGSQNRKYIRKADLDTFLNQNYHRKIKKNGREIEEKRAGVTLLPRT